MTFEIYRKSLLSELSLSYDFIYSMSEHGIIPAKLFGKNRFIPSTTLLVQLKNNLQCESTERYVHFIIIKPG